MVKKRQRVPFQVKAKLVKNENEGMCFKCKIFSSKNQKSLFEL